MTGKHVVGALAALALFVVGGFLALTGMGYLGDSDETSTSWSVIGSVLAGFGVALAITVFQPRR